MTNSTKARDDGREPPPTGGADIDEVKGARGTARSRERKRRLEERSRARAEAANVVVPDRADVVIVGAGASGLVAAIAAASVAGATVVLLEAAEEPGLPILVTGNGRCNLANVDLSPVHYNAPEFVGQVMGSHPLETILDLFGEVGLVVEEEDEGRLYPRSRQAASVRNLLLDAARRRGVVTAPLREVTGIGVVRRTLSDGTESTASRVIGAPPAPVASPEMNLSGSGDSPAADGPSPSEFDGGANAWESPFWTVRYLDRSRTVRTDTSAEPGEQVIRAGSVILATGGGTRDLAEGLDLPLVDARPALCGLACEASPLDGLDGRRVEALVTLERTDRPSDSDRRTRVGDGSGNAGKLGSRVRLGGPESPGEVGASGSLGDLDGADFLGKTGEPGLSSERHESDEPDNPLPCDLPDEATEAGASQSSGEVLFREGGLTGPPILDLSRFAEPGDRLFLDLVPDRSHDEVVAAMTRHLDDRDRPLPIALDGLLDPVVGRTIVELARKGWPLPADSVVETAAALAKALPLTVSGRVAAHAQVTQGGIALDVIDPMTMAVTSDDTDAPLPSGLFATGEVLDVDGPCGGYNLSFAWLSGLRAGRAAARLATTGSRVDSMAPSRSAERQPTRAGAHASSSTASAPDTECIASSQKKAPPHPQTGTSPSSPTGSGPTLPDDRASKDRP